VGLQLLGAPAPCLVQNGVRIISTGCSRMEEQEERGLTKDLKKYARLAVTWDPHGSPVPRWRANAHEGFGKVLLRLSALAQGRSCRVAHAPKGRRIRLAASVLCAPSTRPPAVDGCSYGGGEHLIKDRSACCLCRISELIRDKWKG